MKILLIGGKKGLGKAILDRLEWRSHTVKTLMRPEFDLLFNENLIKEKVKIAIKELGGCDILIVSSGIGAYYKPTISGNIVEKIMKINFLSPAIIFRACQRALLKSKGKAIFISSVITRKPASGGLSYYAASKGALNSWITSEGRRQAKHGIALCAVSPGFFNSDMTKDVVLPVKKAAMKNIPFKRFGNCDEISDFIVSLIYQSNWCLAGSIYEVSGGA